MSAPASPRPLAALLHRLARLLDWLKEGESDGTLGEGLPRFFLLFLLLFGAGMILISLIGDQGLIAYTGLKREAGELRSEVERLRLRRTTLVQQIEALNDDPGYIEHLARKRLGLVKPGEVVLQLPRREGFRE